MLDSNARARLRALAGTTFTTTMGGTVPDAGRASALRKQYLNWHEEAEVALAAVHSDEADALQTARHRDIVAGRVTPDELYRNINSEQMRIRQKLNSLAAAPEVLIEDPVSSQFRELRPRSGRRYTWNANDILGTGAFGRVYSGVDETGGVVAIKRIELRSMSTKAWFDDARLAERELEVHRHLGSHPNVVPMLDEHLDEDALWIVMPLAGESLHARVQRGGPLPEAEVKALALDLLAALRLLASKSVLHRDIKPGNVLRYRGRWALGDLGIGQLIAQTETAHTWKGTGTYEYWAPELFDHHEATVRTDLYALGCTLFEALTGRTPFIAPDLATAHRTREPDVPSLIDHALQRCITQLLAKHPDRRPEDARQVEEALNLSSPSEGQIALQEMAALHSKQVLAQEARQARAASVEEERQSARESLGRIWDDLGHLAQAADPDAQAFDQSADTWFLRASFGRLAVQISEPSASSSALWIGIVSVKFLDDPTTSYVANVRCLVEGDGHRWALLRFLRNDISNQNVTLGPQFQDGPSGLGLSAFDAIHPEINEMGIPPVIPEAWDLGPEALLKLLTGEMRAYAAQRAEQNGAARQ